MTERRCNETEHRWHDAGRNPNTEQSRVRCKACGDIREMSQEQLVNLARGAVSRARAEPRASREARAMGEERCIDRSFEGSLVHLVDPRPGLAAERDKLQNQLVEVRETLERTEATLQRVHVLIEQWRKQAASLYPSQDPRSPSWLTDCAEDLEIALENE